MLRFTTYKLEGNPLDELVQQTRTAQAEKLPDEQLGDTLCQVYRVKDTTLMGDFVSRMPFL